jgi:hypothetical protein
MQKLCFSSLLCCFVFGFAAAQDLASASGQSQTVTSASTNVNDDPANSPREAVAARLKAATDAQMSADFRPNKGQWRTLAMFRMTQDDKNAQFFTNGVEFGETVAEIANNETTQKGYLWGFTFIRSDKWVKLTAKYPKGGTNHVIGKDRIAFIASHAELWYEDVFRSIDLRFYGSNKQQFLYDFVAQPYSEIKDIQLQLTGVEEWSVDKNGELDIKFDAKLTKHFAITAFQYNNEEQKSIKIRFIKTDEGHLGYQTLEPYQVDKALVIRQL